MTDLICKFCGKTASAPHAPHAYTPEDPAIDASQVRKNLAEAAKLEAETASILASNALHAEIGAIRLAKAKRDEALLLTQPQTQHVIKLNGGIDRTSVDAVIERLDQFHVMAPKCAISIYVNGPGGEALEGYALIDHIRRLRQLGHKITMIGQGWVASMASLILQAADVRVMTSETWMVVHKLSYSTGGQIDNNEDELMWAKRMVEQAAATYIDRSNGKLTREVLDTHWTRRNWYLSAHEALDLGLIDEVW